MFKKLLFLAIPAIILGFVLAYKVEAVTPSNQGVGGTGTSTTFSLNSLILQGSGGYKGVATGTLGTVLLMQNNIPTWVATSTLGITGGGSGTPGGNYGQVQYNNAGSFAGAVALLTNGTVSGVNATSSTVSFNVQGTGALNPFNIASSTGTALLTVAVNGSTTISSLSAGIVQSTSGGALYVVPTNTYQAAGNYITALTGDVTASGPGSVAATLATVNSNVGTFGSATQVGQFTVNGKGLITAASAVSIALPASAITSGVLPVSIGGIGTTTLGNLTVGTNLSVTGGQLVLVGTSTQISLGTSVVTSVSTSSSGTVFTGSISSNNLALVFPVSPTFTTLTVTGQTTLGNASATALTLSNNLWVTGQSNLSNSSTTNLSVTTNTYLTNIASGNCLQTGAGGLITSAGAACGSGSGNSAWTIGNALIYNATTTDSVLVGTTTPTTANLFVQGSGTKNPLTVASSSGKTILQVASAGYVAINSTTTPTNSTLLALNLNGATNNLLSWSIGGLTTAYAGNSSALFSGTPATDMAILAGNAMNLGVSGLATPALSISSTGKVGVNTTTQTATLSVVGLAGSINPFQISSSTAAALFTVAVNGYTGIGTTTPQATLVLQGTPGQTQDYLTIASSTGSSIFRVAPNGTPSLQIGTSTMSTVNFIMIDSVAAATTTMQLGDPTHPVCHKEYQPNGTALYWFFNNTGNISTSTATCKIGF